MNLRDLKYLLSVAEHRHFGKAAQACFVSQPTLSGQIKKLEEDLGVTVFERNNRSVRVTPVGEQLLALARRALEQVEAMEQLAAACRDPLSGPLRLGVIPTLGPYLMPLILKPLRSDYPNLHLILREEITELLLQHLHDHELDAILIATSPGDEDLLETALFDEPFWLAFPSGHPLYEAEEITETNLPTDELLLLADGHCLAEQVTGLCDPLQHHRTGDDLRAASLETLIQLVSAGFGCTLVPALSLGASWSSGSGVILRPVQMPSARRRIRLITRSTFPRPASVEALAELIRRHLPNTAHWLGHDSGHTTRHAEATGNGNGNGNGQ